ncbi:hypothetical protein ACW95P_02120 [Candidatus Mycoplasma pogonae]
MRFDGKTKLKLLLSALFFGLFGGEYFYVKRNKLAWLKLLIAWVGLTLIIVTLIIWGTTSKESIQASIEGSKDYKELISESKTQAAKVYLELTLARAQEIMYKSVLAFTIIGALIASLPLIWSFFNVYLIAIGDFKDEFNKPVHTWNATYQDFAEYLLGGEYGHS